jgi:hypothetical protein
VCSFLINDARAETVVNWRDPANYPARVNSIQFSSGKLAAGSPVRIGSWTIRFGNRSPVAKYQTSPDCNAVQVEEFICSNSVIGEKQCQMWFAVRGCTGNTGATACGVTPLMAEDYQIMQRFEVPCPANL